MDQLQQIIALVAAKAWLPLAAIGINFAVRLLKSDVKFPIDLPAQYRSAAALLLGAVSGVLQMIISGTAVGPALLNGLVAALTAMGAHSFVVDGIRSGRELPVPLMMREPPPSSGGPGLKTLGAALFLVVFGLPGCNQQQAKDVTTVANDVVKVATVLCENDQAFEKGITPLDASLFCRTQEQLAPYMAVARKRGPALAACAR